MTDISDHTDPHDPYPVDQEHLAEAQPAQDDSLDHGAILHLSLDGQDCPTGRPYPHTYVPRCGPTSAMRTILRGEEAEASTGGGPVARVAQEGGSGCDLSYRSGNHINGIMVHGKLPESNDTYASHSPVLENVNDRGETDVIEYSSRWLRASGLPLTDSNVRAWLDSLGVPVPVGIRTIMAAVHRGMIAAGDAGYATGRMEAAR